MSCDVAASFLAPGSCRLRFLLSRSDLAESLLDSDGVLVHWKMQQGHGDPFCCLLGASPLHISPTVLRCGPGPALAVALQRKVLSFDLTGIVDDDIHTLVGNLRGSALTSLHLHGELLRL